MGDTLLPRDADALGWRDVRGLLDAVLDRAQARGLRVVAAVVDQAGRLIGLQGIPGAFMTSTSVAVAKAFTASNFGTTTEALVERIPGEIRADLASVDRRLTFIRGGFPICRDGRVIGGIGVSGATSEEDADLARQALEALDIGGGD